VLTQDRYLTSHIPDALESHVLGADPRRRRRGMGTALQQDAAQQCRIAGCYHRHNRQTPVSTRHSDRQPRQQPWFRLLRGLHQLTATASAHA
jgi:GNAT superfamily N-acetyltransferase